MLDWHGRWRAASLLLRLITWAVSLAGVDMIVGKLPLLMLVLLLHEAPLAVEAVRVVAATARHQGALALALTTDDRPVWVLVHEAG